MPKIMQVLAVVQEVLKVLLPLVGLRSPKMATVPLVPVVLTIPSSVISWLVPVESQCALGVACDIKITSPNAHWDSTGTNQLMTLLGVVNTTGTNGTVAIFGLRNPTSGNKTFSTSWTTASTCMIFGISFTGVDQTSDAAAFAHFNSATGNSTAPSVTITSATGNIIVGAFVNDSNAIDWTSVNNTTLCVNAGIQLAMNR